MSANTTRTGIGSVTEETIVARSAVVCIQALSSAASISSAHVTVVTVTVLLTGITAIADFITGIYATRITGMGTTAARTSIATVTEETVITRIAIVHIRALSPAAGIGGTHVAVVTIGIGLTGITGVG
jgi:hypothetical protein